MPQQVENFSTWSYLIFLFTIIACEAIPITKEGSGPGPPVPFITTENWFAFFGGLTFCTFAVTLCVCCRKKSADTFHELHRQARLSNFSEDERNNAEVTLFPPPSLVLSHEDLNVRFEPLPSGPQRSLFHTYRPKELEEWIENGFGLFPRSNIQYLREIGRGWFGQVLDAEIKGLDSPQSVTRCAVKILRPEANGLQQAKFVKEVEPLRLLNHPNVLKLFGCCLESPPLLILLQHCPNGDLKLFLQAYQEQANCRMPLPENVLLRFACEAAEGLLCWHRAGLVHEDVAARSFMLTGDLTVVLGNYGLNLSNHEPELVNVGQNPVPIRWIAPELYDSTAAKLAHTKASNVWSFGVVLWEIICLGRRPYAMLSDEEVIQQVLQEKRTILTAPSGHFRTEQVLYQIMLQCWEVDAQLRPPIEEIISRLVAASVTVSRDLEQDFELKWNSAGVNHVNLSPTGSLNNLHGSYEDLVKGRKASTSSENDDTENGYSAKVSAALRSLDEALAAVGEAEEAALPLPDFRLGSTIPRDENGDDSSTVSSIASSKSWQDRVAGGEMEALVREKSRSVQDFMVLTHVEPLSDIDFISRDLDREKEVKNNVPDIQVTSMQEAANNESPQPRFSRLRLTSTPCSDDESKQFSLFSPESLNGSNLDPNADVGSSVILGPSEDLGLDFFQALTTTQGDGASGAEDDEGEEDVEGNGKEEVNIQVNIEAWDRFLEEACEQQHAERLPLNVSREPAAVPRLRDSGIARPSFSGSLDILGSTFDDSSRNPVQKIKTQDNEENSKRSSELSPAEKEVQISQSQLESSPSQDRESGNTEGSRAGQTTPFDTYFSYGKIDEDIRGEPSPEILESPVTTGKSILAELQMKNRLQRRTVEPDSSSDSDSEEEDQEEVLIVDLETKRAVLVEAQSPKLKTALANEDFETIFSTDANPGQSLMKPEAVDQDYSPDFESESENEEEKPKENVAESTESSDDDEDDGIEGSSFVWQAAYCRKIQPSLSMEIIEEECEDEEAELEEEISSEDFVPSTWRKEATPSKSALKSPEKSPQRKNVSWMKPGRKVYNYTVEETEDDARKSSVPSSPRRRWSPATSNAEATYASFADWDFALDDEQSEENQQRLENEEDVVDFRPKAKDVISGSLFYRLSDIDGDNDEEGEFYVDEQQDPLWTKGVNLSQFQPSQYFTNWDNKPEEELNKPEHSPPAQVGTLRHSIDSLRLDLPDSISSNSHA